MAERPRRPTPALVRTGIVLVGGIVLAACGGTTSGSAAATSRGPASASASAGPAVSTGTTSAGVTASSAAGSAVTVRTASVAGYGTVLVDGSGRSLYVLSTERGGTITCTAANGCTRIWAPITLPSGTTAATAGSGVTASALGTVTSAGVTRVTYHHWPLYTYIGDSGPGQANGENIHTFGGTWTLLSPAGTPVAARSGSASAASSGSSGGGYY